MEQRFVLPEKPLPLDPWQTLPSSASASLLPLSPVSRQVIPRRAHALPLEGVLAASEPGVSAVEWGGILRQQQLGLLEKMGMSSFMLRHTRLTEFIALTNVRLSKDTVREQHV